MLEMLQAVLASLLLSAGVGVGADTSKAGDDEPNNSETGVDVGKMPSYLVSPRGLTQAEQDDDQQPAALEQVCFREPAVWCESTLSSAHSPAMAVPFATAGRSP
ncbi:MAG: hypothetical protein AAF711_15535 [Planctomycetota bacterium]